MSGRKLGGGRVLGSGRSLSPAAVIYPKRNSSLLSPSASSVSLNSSTSTSHTSTEAHDLSSRVSLDQNDGAGAVAVAAASSRLACPICNEEMVRLLKFFEDAQVTDMPYRSPSYSLIGSQDYIVCYFILTIY